jgi:hypothetical protein
MRRPNPSRTIARYLRVTARRLRRGPVGDPRIIASLLERAADLLVNREVSA